MTDRRGFTLVELMAVAILGSFMVMAAYQVLITNQRAYTIQGSKVQAQQNTRAAMEILFGELREVSAGGADIVDFGAQKLTVRAMRKVGVVCENNPMTFGTTPTLLVRQVADLFEVGDSVFVFADNDEYKTSDDTWIEGVVTANMAPALCEGTYDAQLMSFGGQAAAFVADTVREGAPIRSFTQYTYSLDEYGGAPFLGRAEAEGDWVPLVGPINGPDGQPGLEFTYLDEGGEETTERNEVRRIVVKVRSFSAARDQQGQLVVDSLSASVHLRN